MKKLTKEILAFWKDASADINKKCCALQKKHHVDDFQHEKGELSFSIAGEKYDGWVDLAPVAQKFVDEYGKLLDGWRTAFVSFMQERGYEEDEFEEGWFCFSNKKGQEVMVAWEADDEDSVDYNG